MRAVGTRVPHFHLEDGTIETGVISIQVTETVDYTIRYDTVADMVRAMEAAGATVPAIADGESDSAYVDRLTWGELGAGDVPKEAPMSNAVICHLIDTDAAEEMDRNGRMEGWELTD